jgi:hypothetical protein
MFGHDDNNGDQNDTQYQDAPQNDMQSDSDNHDSPAPSLSDTVDSSATTLSSDASSPQDSEPHSDDSPSSIDDNPSPAPSDGFDLPSSPDSVGTTNNLIDIKSQALHQLTPLVDHLDQTPEEKFKTTMMMIQASDNQALIQDAYAIAQQITDEKAKAQALLDIINEINYFTQQQAEK